MLLIHWTFLLVIEFSCLQIQKTHYATTVVTTKNIPPTELDEDSERKMNNAARMFMERAREYDEMIEDARLEYQLGLRHLANMMGEDPEMFTQKHANVSSNTFGDNLMAVVNKIFYMNFQNLNRKLLSICFHRGFMIKKRVPSCGHPRKFFHHENVFNSTELVDHFTTCTSLDTRISTIYAM